MEAAARVLGMQRDELSQLVREGRVRTVDINGRQRIGRAEIQRIEIEGIPPAKARAVTRTATREEVESWKPKRR